MRFRSCHNRRSRGVIRNLSLAARHPVSASLTTTLENANEHSRSTSITFSSFNSRLPWCRNGDRALCRGWAIDSG